MTPIYVSSQDALDRACSLALVQPYTARIFAHVAMERAFAEDNVPNATAALSLYTVLGGNFHRAGMA